MHKDESKVAVITGASETLRAMMGISASLINRNIFVVWKIELLRSRCPLGGDSQWHSANLLVGPQCISL